MDILAYCWILFWRCLVISKWSVSNTQWFILFDIIEREFYYPLVSGYLVVVHYSNPCPRTSLIPVRLIQVNQPERIKNSTCFCLRIIHAFIDNLVLRTPRCLHFLSNCHIEFSLNYNQQFQGTILLMVFWLTVHGVYIYIICIYCISPLGWWESHWNSSSHWILGW